MDLIKKVMMGGAILFFAYYGNVIYYAVTKSPAFKELRRLEAQLAPIESERIQLAKLENFLTEEGLQRLRGLETELADMKQKIGPKLSRLEKEANTNMNYMIFTKPGVYVMDAVKSIIGTSQNPDSNQS